MARRHPVAGSPGGGAGIQALRPARARLITGALAVVALAAAVVYAGVTGGRFAPAADAAGALGLSLLLAALVVRSPAVVPWAIFFAAAGYLAGREGKDLVDGWAAVLGVLLLLAAELAAWSIEHDARIRSERTLTIRRIATLVVLGAVALLVNFLLLGTAAVAAGPGIVLAAAGVAAAVAAITVVLRLVRS